LSSHTARRRVSYAVPIPPCDASRIAKCFKSRDFTDFKPGIFLDERYQFLQVHDDKFVIGKRGAEGAVAMQASKTAVVIAHCPDGGNLGNTSKGVAVVADYLESMNM